MSPPKFGRYTLRGILGHGGMGVVYKALDPELDREVAIKVLSPGISNLKRARQRFLKEARAVARLDHPNIIDIWDIGDDGEQVFFAMRLISGPSLSARLKNGRLPPDEAAQICADLARALHHAHQRGIIHRDIKPSNILFEGDVPVLTDFGVVKLTHDEGPPLTRDAQVVGTAPYLAPELLERGADQANASSDQYALGVLLYETLTARRPHAGGTPIEVLNSILTGEPVRLESLGIPSRLARVCRRAMTRRPQDRFSDLGQLATALDHWRGGASPLSWSQDLAREIRSGLHRRRRSTTRAVVGILAAATLWGGVQLWQEQSRERAAAVRLAGLETRIKVLWARGQIEEADQIFLGFTNFEDNQETRALAQAWLHRGKRFAAEADHVGALTALTASYARSYHEVDQARALFSLASVLREDCDWDRLAQVLNMLEVGDLTPAQLSDVSEFHASLRVAGGDLRAHSGSDPQVRKLLTALSPTTRTDHYTLDATVLNEDHILLLDRSHSARVVAREPALPELYGSAFDPDRRPLNSLNSVPSTANHPTAILTQSREGTCRTEVWSTNGSTVGAPFPCSAPFAATRADLDGDGTDELYIGDDRKFVRAVSTGEGWRLEDAHPSTSLANAQIRDVVVADLDGDGVEEIIVALGYWGGYDLRVLRWQEGRLQLIARAQLGVLLDLTVYRRDGETLIAAMETRSDFIDKRVFSESNPDTTPLGIHLFAFDGEALLPRGSLPEPIMTHQPPATSPTDHYARRLISGDLDGDGNDELIHGIHRDNTFIYTPAGDGWARVSLNLGFPILSADLDGDGDDELLLREWQDPDRLLVLGAGQVPEPGPDVTVRQAHPSPAGLSETDRRRWQRIEQLIAAGFPTRGLTELESFSKLRAGTLAEALAWRRSGELSKTLGAPKASALSYRRAASEPTLAAESLEAAIQAFEEAMLLEPALAAAQRRLALPEPPPQVRERAATLEDLNNQPQVVLDYVRGLDPRGRVRSASGVRWDPETGGLRLRGTAGQQLLMLPLRASGERVRVAVEFQVDRLDWGSKLHITLAGRSGSTDIATWWGWGGGGTTVWSAVCAAPFGPHLKPATRIPHLKPAVAAGRTMTLILDTLPTQDRGVCELRREDRTDGYMYGGDNLHSLQEALADGEVDLTISISGFPVVTEVLIKKITLEGFALREHPADPLELANLAIAEGRSSHALSLLKNAPQDDLAVQLAAVVARLALGHSEAARLHLSTAVQLAEDPIDALLPLLLADPERYAAPIQEALGPDYPELVVRAYGFTVGAHGDRADVRRELASALSVVNLDGVTPRTAATLLTWDAGHARHNGRYDRGERVLLDGWSRIDQAPPSERAEAYSEYARLLTLMRRYPEALKVLTQAVDIHPSPEGFADKLTAEALFGPLHAYPQWAEIQAARKLSMLAPFTGE